MKRQVAPVLLSCLALAMSAACGSTTTDGKGGAGGGTGGSSGNGGSAGGTGGSAGGTGGAVECKGTSVVANEANNYGFTSSITLTPIKVQPKSNLTFDWSAVTADLVGHAVDPKKDLNSILIFEWKLTLQELETKLDKDQLDSIDLVTQPPISHPTDGNETSAKLLDFGLNGSPIGADGGLITVDQVMLFLDPTKYDPAEYTLTVMATTGKVLGQGTRMLQAFQLDEGSTNTTVTMTKDSTKLTYKADLHSMKVTGVPAGKANITLDWGQMHTNVIGNEFNPTSITRIIVARYSKTTTQLEDDFLNLETIADKLYKGQSGSGSKIDFSTLADDQGNKFPGIDGNGTWLVALMCDSCKNPAPWYLTILKPCN